MIANNVGVVGRIDHDFRQIGVLVRDAAHISDSEAWIGFRSTILSGVSIKRGAVVAAGSVVTDDVEAYDIVSGNPAKRIGRRFTHEQIAAHEAGIAR